MRSSYGQDRCVIHAPAKVNLSLRVLGKRSDGYHELETLMVRIGLYDSLQFLVTPDAEIDLQCRFAWPTSSVPAENALAAGTDSAGTGSAATAVATAGLPVDGSNLIVKAARLLQDVTGTRLGARISLLKRIPLQAGLAGGSTDAAATLLALNQLWRLGLSREELVELSSRLGSDIPFFVAGSSAAICRGRGERIEPVRLPVGIPLLIAKPLSGLSTAAVFKQCRIDGSGLPADQLLGTLRQQGLRGLASGMSNSLQQPAIELNPDVARLSQLFSRLPVLGHQMSGSGTSYFAICQQLKQARHLAGRLKGQFEGHLFVVSTVI